MSNQGRKPQQEDDSRFIMAYCMLGIIILLSWMIIFLD
jgi:hypothetical protein